MIINLAPVTCETHCEIKPKPHDGPCSFPVFPQKAVQPADLSKPTKAGDMKK